MPATTESGRKFARIRIKTDLICEEASELCLELTGDNEQLQAAFRKCLSLWHLWRSLVDDVDGSVPAAELRSLASGLRRAAESTLGGCAALRLVDGHPEYEDDLKLMDRELVNVASWLADWPADDSTQRDATRNAPEDYVSDEELLAMAK